jgi:competence protein ComEC
MFARVHDSRNGRSMNGRSMPTARGLAAAAALRTGLLRDHLAEAVKQQRDRWFLWAPVCLTAGSAVYFALPIEPHWLMFGLAAAALAGLSAVALAGKLQPLSVFLAVIVAGVLLAKLRTEIVRHPELLATTGVVELAGWVEFVEPLGKGRLRLVVGVDNLSGIRPEATPPRLRVNINRPTDLPQLGQYITLRARLTPLPGPVKPGGYDFARTLWFQGIGATGVGFGQPEISADRSRDVSWSARAGIEAVRGVIRDRIAQALPDELAGFSAALIIGERSGIPAETQTALQISGLAHILAISGLHMSLMAGSVFWLLRAGLALIPGLALNYPIKKWAACGTLLAGLAYLSISGWSVATQRAYVMLAVMCLAVVLDRPAITMRNLALAGIIILLATPEAVLTASFQMSFLAVMGLIAFYEAVSGWRREQLQHVWPHSLPGRIAMSLALSILAVAATTIVASVFTSLPAAYHFNRVAPYSLLANLLALPIVSTIVMPAAVIAVAAMPVGLEVLPLKVMGLGIGWVAAIAHRVADLPGAGFLVPGMPTLAALVIASGAAWLCLWRGWLRLAGVALVLAGLALAPLGSRPDILIERSGANVAARNPDGLLVPVAPRRARFAVENWLQEDGDMAGMREAAERPGWTCAEEVACRMAVKGYRVAYLREGADTVRECRDVDIVITDFPLRRACRGVPVRIDRFDVWRHGSHAITIRNGAIQVTTAAEQRGLRPWTTPPVARRLIREVEFEGLQSPQ